MVEFKDWKVEDIHSINPLALIIIGDDDVIPYMAKRNLAIAEQ